MLHQHSHLFHIKTMVIISTACGPHAVLTCTPALQEGLRERDGGRAPVGDIQAHYLTLVGEHIALVLHAPQHHTLSSKNCQHSMRIIVTSTENSSNIFTLTVNRFGWLTLAQAIIYSRTAIIIVSTVHNRYSNLRQCAALFVSLILRGTHTHNQRVDCSLLDHVYRLYVLAIDCTYILSGYVDDDVHALILQHPSHVQSVSLHIVQHSLARSSILQNIEALQVILHKKVVQYFKNGHRLHSHTFIYKVLL